SGSGLRAFAASARTLPRVSAPSGGVRSTIEIAVSIAWSFADFLMLRVPRLAALASTPTWSTPGRPCRNRRRLVSSRVASASASGELAVAMTVRVAALLRHRGLIGDDRRRSRLRGDPRLCVLAAQGRRQDSETAPAVAGGAV